MATMKVYGGGPNPPVRLDPFQNIIEVGWRKSVQYVAFSLRLEVIEVSNAGPESATSGTYPAPTGDWDTVWLNETRYRYFSGSVSFPGTPPSSTAVYYADDGWGGSFLPVVVNGLPDLEDGSAGHATYGRFQTTTIKSSPMSRTTGRWIDPGGTALEVPVPGSSGLNFLTGVPEASVFGPSFGEPQPFESIKDSGLYTYFAPFSGGETQSQFALLSGVTVEHDGQTFAPFAAKAVPFTPAGSAVGVVLRGPSDDADGAPHELWVLCQPVTT